MRLIVLVFSIFAVLYSAKPCFGQENTRSELIITGVSPRFSSRNESIQNALKDAARRLSFYNYVSGSSSISGLIGAGTFDYSVEADYMLQYDEDLEKYAEELDYNPLTDIFENNNAVFVITRAKSSAVMPLFRGHSLSAVPPGWVNEPPKYIDGFIAGVGFSVRYYSHHDTIIKSYEDAVINLIRNIKTSVSSEYIEYTNTDYIFDYAHIFSGESTASGTLKNFYILESWTDPINLSVWTLAVADKEFFNE